MSNTETKAIIVLMFLGLTALDILARSVVYFALNN